MPVSFAVAGPSYSNNEIYESSELPILPITHLLLTLATPDDPDADASEDEHSSGSEFSDNDSSEGDEDENGDENEDRNMDGPDGQTTAETRIENDFE
jgi:hypothetical protein